MNANEDTMIDDRRPGAYAPKWPMLAAIAAALIVGCPASRRPPGASSTATGSTVSIVPARPSPPAATTASDVARAGEHPSGSGPLLGVDGRVKAPVFSADRCVRDDECVGLRTCHPDRCVLAANAGVLVPGTMCTENCVAATLDCGYNHCGCAPSPDGTRRCAVLPGEKP